MLHRLPELDGQIREAYAAFDYKSVIALLSQFMTSDLSAFYFDMRKDALYCDPPSSAGARRRSRPSIDIFRRVTDWLAPILVFTAEEAWLARYPERAAPCISSSSRRFPPNGATTRWPRTGRSHPQGAPVVTGALEIERAQKRIGSSLEAAPHRLRRRRDRCARRSRASISPKSASPPASRSTPARGPADAFRLPDVAGVAVVPHARRASNAPARGNISIRRPRDPDYPDVTPRDAKALRELTALGRWSAL